MSSESDKGRTQIDSKLLEILVCPLTKTTLQYDAGAQELISKAAGLAYPIRDGVPLLTVDDARRLDDAPRTPQSPGRIG
jgi:uncharacterized protein YbaR (Trm112 family)